MSVQDMIKKSVLESGVFDSFNVPQMTISLIVALLLGAVIYMIYSKFYVGVIFSRSFAVTLVGMTLLTCMVTLAISTNIVISLGMVGALSIVRFRTAIKDPMDLIFLFWSISIGIICGAEMYKIGMIMSLVLTIGLFLLELTPMGKASVLLVVNAKDAQAEAGIMQIVGQYAKRPAVKSRNLSKDGMDLIIEIKTAQENKLLAELLAAQNVYGASLMAHDGEIM